MTAVITPIHFVLVTLGNEIRQEKSKLQAEELERKKHNYLYLFTVWLST